MNEKRNATKDEMDDYLNDINETTEEMFARYLNLMNNTNKYTPDSAADEVSQYSKKEL